MTDELMPPGAPKKKRSATGAANFEDYFSANQDVAARQAQQQAEAVRKQAEAAQTGLNSAVGQFDAKAKSPWAQPGTSTTAANFSKPSTNVGAASNTAAPPQQRAPGAKATGAQGADQGEDFEGYFAGGGRQPVNKPMPPQGGQPIEPGNAPVNGYALGNTGGDSRGAATLLGVTGNQGYTGPESLNDIEGYTDTLKAEKAAQTQLNLLGSDAGLQTLAQERNPGMSLGNSAFEAGLAGRAGGTEFNALRQQFNPDEDVKTAEASAIAKGKQVKKDVNEKAAKNLQASKDMTGRLDAADEAKANADAEAKARGDKDAADAKSKEAKHKQFVDFVTANPQDVLREVGKNTDVAGGLVNLITGGDTVSDKVADYFEKGTPQASRKFSTSFSLMNASNPEVAEKVFNSMSEEDWAKFNSLSDGDQRKWLEQRSQEVG